MYPIFHELNDYPLPQIHVWISLLSVLFALDLDFTTGKFIQGFTGSLETQNQTMASTV